MARAARLWAVGAALLGAVLPALGQASYPVQAGTAAPTGTCTAATYKGVVISQPTGEIYRCIDLDGDGTATWTTLADGDFDGNGTADTADWDGNGTADETGNAFAGAIYAQRTFSARSTGPVDFDGNGTAWTPLRTHESALVAARSHASLFGDPDYYLKGGVYDAYTDVFRGHPLHADYDRDGTAGDDGVGTNGEDPAAVISQCYQANCSLYDQQICVNSVDPDSDGTDEFVVGDVVAVGNSSDATTPKIRSHIITAIATDSANCGTGNKKLTVIPGVDQTGEGVAANVKLANIWHNSYHPSSGGYYFLGYKLGYASRLMYGVQGPNLLRNGNADYDGGAAARVENWTQSDGDGSMYGGSFSDTPANYNQCFEGGTSNVCFYSVGAGTTSTDSKDTIPVTPGEKYVLSGWYQAQYSEVIGLASDADQDGTWSFESGMSFTVGMTPYWFGLTLSPWPFWYTFEIPEGIHAVRVRIARGSGSANWVDDWTLRKVRSSWLTDSFTDATHIGYATKSFLINDPGDRLVVVTGDSWTTGTATINTGLAAALEARYGRSFTSQVINTGHGGDTAADLLGRFYDAIEKYEPLYVVVVIGTNDAYGSVPAADFVRNVREIQRRCMMIGAIPIFVSVNPIGIGPWGAGTPFTRSHDLRDAERRALLNDGPPGGGSIRTTPFGANTQVQYNRNGEFGAESTLTYTEAEDRIRAGKVTVGDTCTLGAATSLPFGTMCYDATEGMLASSGSALFTVTRAQNNTGGVWYGNAYYGPKAESAFSYNEGTDTLTAVTFSGALSGNASTATKLAANGGNCSAGQAPLGVDDSGAVEGCWTVGVGSGDDLNVDGTATASTSPNLDDGGDINFSYAAPNVTATVKADSISLTDLSDDSNVVVKNAANTWSTGAQDMGSATSFKMPVAAGAAPATNGFIAYDSTNNYVNVAINGASNRVHTNEVCLEFWTGYQRGTFVNTTTYYMSPSSNNAALITTEAQAYQLSPYRNMVFKNMTCRTSVNITTGTWTFTLYDDGSSTGITCAIGSSTSTCSDTTHSSTVSAGSWLDYRVVPASTPTAPTYVACSVCMVSP